MLNRIRDALRQCRTPAELDATAKEFAVEFASLAEDEKAIVRNLKAYMRRKMK